MRAIQFDDNVPFFLFNRPASDNSFYIINHYAQFFARFENGTFLSSNFTWAPDFGLRPMASAFVL